MFFCSGIAVGTAVTGAPRTDPYVLTPTTHYTPQPTPGRTQAMVAAALELLLDRRQSTAHPFRLRKPNQLETFSSLGLTAGMCKAEKVKRLALAATLSITSVYAVAAELDQAGLLRMQGQSKLLHPLA